MVKKIKPGQSRIYKEEKKLSKRKYRSFGIFDTGRRGKTQKTGSKFPSPLNH